MNRHTIYQRPTASRAGGFTLVELLVAVTIIAILATVVLGALASAREAARVAKTRSTIAKIHDIVMAKYEGYRTRRLPVSTAGMNAQAAAQVRLEALRDLMRMEMPERWTDVSNATPNMTPYLYPSGVQIARPAVSASYLRRLSRAKIAVEARYGVGTGVGQGTERLGRYASAECLYMIVTTGDPDARAQFHDSEVGDVDDDTLPEFLDAWGNPIKFLRWAPGFIGSDLQWNVAYLDTSTSPAVAVIDPRQTAQAAVSDHDPFDPFKIDMDPTPTDPATGSPDDDTKGRGWRLVPLIYSAGPDGIYDINTGGTAYAYRGSPYIEDPAVTPQVPLTIGAPVDSDNTSVTATGTANGQLDHYDNIHNHRLED